MKRQHQQLNDDAFDERGLLRDGATYRASVTLMDAAPAPRTDKRRPLLARIGDGTNSPVGLNKPGWRVPSRDAEAQWPRHGISIADRQKVLDAREQYDAQLTSAWRNPLGLKDADDPIIGAGERGGRGGRGLKQTIGEGEEGSVCTVKNSRYAAYFGAPGHVKNGICTPDELNGNGDDDDDDDNTVNQTSDAKHHTVDALQRHHDQKLDPLYDDYDHELTQKWRQS